MAIYSEPSKELFEFSQNEDGTYTLTALLKKDVDHLEIPEGVSSIDWDYDVDAEEDFNPETVSFPSTLKSIGKSAFLFNGRMETLFIPGNVTYIAEAAFQQSNFVSVEFGEGLEEIDFAVFSLCKRLETVIIPASCKKIGWRCFAECDSLQSVIFRDPKGWTKLNFDHKTRTHKKALFGSLSEATLSDPRLAAELLKKDIAIGKK